MQHTLITEHLEKRIGKKELLCDISLTLGGGKIYGFVGENGSGKTMLFRTLSGLVKPTKGAVLLDGVDIHKKRGTVRIGVIIENSGMWPDLTGWENLFHLSALNHYISRKDIGDVMLRVGLDPDNALPIRKYSLGMRQRLMIAQAVMEQPDFLFLDEPTNSIDQEGTAVIRQIISEEAQRGAVVLMASHIGEDISELCTELYTMKAGHCFKLGGKGND